jgi:hypothetical protein
MAKKRVLEVELVGTLERTEDTAAIMVRSAEARRMTGQEMSALDGALKAVFGEGVLMIVLGPGEFVEALSEGEMAARGWVRGALSEDGRTSIRRTR